MKSLALLLAILLAADYTGANPTTPANLQDESDNDVENDIIGDALSAVDEWRGEQMPNTENGNNYYKFNENPEGGKYAQGDELLPQQDGVNARAAIVEQDYRWPGGKVPYVISSSFGGRERGMISKAITQLEVNTCIRVVPKSDNDQHWIHFYKGDGCMSYVGRQTHKPEQKVSLGGTCLSKVGTPIHEIMHALGFFHEQSRQDRDKYVEIKFDNIIPVEKHNFIKEEHVLRELPYDTGSVMHYSSYLFSRNGKKTIVAKGGQTLGQRKGLSPLDIKKINKLYNCPEGSGRASHACGENGLRCIMETQYCSKGLFSGHQCKDLRRKGKFCTGSRQCKSKNCGVCWFRPCCKAP